MCDNKRQLSAINLCRKKSNQNGYILLHKFQDTRLSLNKIYLELFCYTVYGKKKVHFVKMFQIIIV